MQDSTTIGTNTRHSMNIHMDASMHACICTGDFAN